MSKKLYKLIKSENHLIQSYEAAGKERLSIASQLSDWGEATTDEAISDISDKIGVLLSELGEQEDLYAHNLDDSRAILKAIRNTEKSVQPSRDNKAKIHDEIAKLKAKEPESAKLVTLEQELVRAEAENLVAEAQLTNIVRSNTRHKLRTATDVRNRLARSSRRHTLLNLPQQLNVPRSKSSWHDTAADCSTFSMILQLFQEIFGPLTSTPTRPDKSSMMQKMTSRIGSQSWKMFLRMQS